MAQSAHTWGALLLLTALGTAQVTTPPPAPIRGPDLSPHPVFDNPEPKFPVSCDLGTLGPRLSKQYNYLSMTSSALANYCLVSRMNDAMKKQCGYNGTISSPELPAGMDMTSMITVSEGKTTLNSACCGRCTAMFGNEVSLILYPSVTAAPNGTNATIPTTIISDGYTYSQGSAYVRVSTGYVLDGCHTTEEEYFSTSSVVAINPTEINSQFTYMAPGETTLLVSTYIQSKQQSDCDSHLKTAQSTDMRTSYYPADHDEFNPAVWSGVAKTTYISNPCKPLILFPAEFVNIVGNDCYGQAMLDPPSTLNPFAGLATPAPVPAKETNVPETPTPTPASPSMFNPEPAKETGGLLQPQPPATPTPSLEPVQQDPPQDPPKQDPPKQEAPKQVTPQQNPQPSQQPQDHPSQNQNVPEPQNDDPPSPQPNPAQPKQQEPTKFTIASQTFEVAPSGNGVIVGSETLTANAPAITVGGNTVSLDSSKFVVGSHTVQLDPPKQDVVNQPSEGPAGEPNNEPENDPASAPDAAAHVEQQPTTFEVAGNTFVAAPSRSEVVVGSQTIRQGGPAVTVNNQPISIDSSNNLVVGTHTQALAAVPSQPVNNAQAPPATQVLTVAGSEFTIPPAASEVQVAGQTLRPGDQAVTINNQPVSLDSNSHLIIGTQTHDLPAAVAPSAHAPAVVTIVDAPVTIAPSATAVTIAGQTIALGSSIILSNGQTVQLATDALVVDRSSIRIPTTVLSAEGQVITLSSATITIPPDATAISIHGAIIQSGAPPATLPNGDIVSFGSEGVVVDGSTYSFPPVAESTASVEGSGGIGDQILRGIGAVDGGVVTSASTTLAASIHSGLRNESSVVALPTASRTIDASSTDEDAPEATASEGSLADSSSVRNTLGWLVLVIPIGVMMIMT